MGNFHDSVAISRDIRGPSLFITVTANPGWPEVKASLLPHQTAAEREDLILWVFHLKLRDLLTDLKDRIARHGPQ